MAENNFKKFDVIVVGGGPGGYTAAILASQKGLTTAIVEHARLGGICLNWGCIPAKSLLRSAEVYELINRAGDFGITVEGVGYKWSEIIRRSREISDTISGGIDFLMKKNKIKVFYGTGILEGNGQLRIESEKESVLTAKNIILATGAQPQSIPGVKIDRGNIITSREALEIISKPESMVIVGGGAIGVEFASLFNSFGTKVTLVEMLDQILPAVDREISKRLETSFRHSGITVMTSTGVKDIKSEGGVCRVQFTDGKYIECEKVLIAAGVTGNINGIGLENAGVICERGFVKVDNACRTTKEGIWAVGDCIGPPLLAHAASMEAECAVESIIGMEVHRIKSYLIPSCIYTKPNVASIGLTEKTAKESGYDTAIGRCPFRSLGKAMTLGETEGLVKVILDKKTGNILGAHIIGTGTNEIIEELVLAMHEGISADRLIKTVHPHPTLSEAIKEAVAGALGKSINQ